ncbi:GBS Bsp-like repeat-containing protein [Streptococcus salivarius]|uniref:GBS Bsp-like repeat-containing protein n=1 Tax=Streptococcus salivarius TaxID=1304 RepID=UPI00267E8E7B
MRTKDFIYYASAAVLMAVTTQVASADEVATQMPTVTEGNQYQPATAADIFGGGAVLAQESPSARPSSTVVVAATATSEVTNSSAPQVSQASSTTIVASESRVVASESVVQANTLASSENASVSTASEVPSEVVAEPAKLTHASGSSYDTDVLKPKANLSIENNNKVTGTFDAVIRNIVAPLGVKEVLIPSWSLANGQDDLIWHKAAKQMDGSYRVTIKAVDHKGEAGNYRADAYVVDRTNKRHYISEKVVSVTYSRPSATLTIENNNATTGTFDAVVKNIIAPTGVKEILVPSWSLLGGQDDLIWHKATKQADGSYRATIKASDHKNSTGEYRADAYIVDNFNKRFYLTEKVVEVSQSRPSASLTIENNNATTGTFDAVVRNIVAPNGLKEILVPSWSLINGQDDLVWHKASKQADGSYRVTIKASEHKHSTGKYRADAYLIDNTGNRQYLTETVVEVNETKPSGSISILNNNGAGTFDVVISDVYSPKGVRTVQVPIWSETDGQDDIRWYEATRQTDGNYKVTVQVANHKNVTGIYNVHLYFIQNDGSRISVGGTQTKVTLSEPKADLAITGLNKATGSYDLVISNLIAPRGFKEVLVPTWSEKNGQDDIIWYKAAKQANGDYKVTVRSSNHKGDSGLYNSHVYLVDNDGKFIGLGGKQVTLDITKTQGTLTITNNDKNRGTFDVLITI